MKKNINLFIIAAIFASMFVSKQVTAQFSGPVPIVLYKLATGYWDQTPNNDTDGDGFINSEDKCPSIFGKINGCPDKDSDGDGISDSKDKCPKVKGTLNGCPDTDGDGVADLDDKCPKVKGTLNGCPDTDGDGVADADDKCPNLKGTVANNGCLLSEEEKSIIKESSSHIYFETGSAKIKSISYPDLDKLTAILKKHPEVKARVEGHTDNTGNAEKNVKLSKARAAAVKKYLIEHGEAADHISSEGYGSAKPIASNDTKEGRAKNRRVEIVISSFK